MPDIDINGAINYNISIDHILTIIISSLNIFVTIILTTVNLYFLRKTSKKSIKREAIINYYIPLKDMIIPVCLAFNKAKTFCEKFDIYDITYDNELKASRKEIIVLYQNYLSEYSKIKNCICFPKIDKLIFCFNLHVRFIIYTNGVERSNNYVVNKAKYPLPDINNIVIMIEREISKCKL